MVRQLINNNGNYAANQFVITTRTATYFQSYNSVVCKIQGGSVTLSSNWDYSKTTMKHLYIFLREYGYGSLCTSKDIRKAIKNGEVTLENVSSLELF